MVTPVAIILIMLATSQADRGPQRSACSIRSMGRVKTYTREKVDLNFPCNFLATNVICDGYQIKVIAGQQIDSRGDYYVDSAWVSIKKVGTDFYWRGRTSASRVSQYLAGDANSPFSPAGERLAGAPFRIAVTTKARDYKVSVTSTKAAFDVEFYALVGDTKRQVALNRVQVQCAHPSYPPDSAFPATLCGNGVDKSAFSERSQQLGIFSTSKAVIYDLLSSDTVQSDPSCQSAVHEFQQCQGNKTQVVEDCSVLIHNSSIINCLQRDNLDPMATFVHCLRYRCSYDYQHCRLLRQAMAVCPGISGGPESCDHLRPTIQNVFLAQTQPNKRFWM